MLYILTPSRTQPHPLTTQCIERIPIPHKVLTVRGLPVDQARNTLASMVFEVASDDDVALWCDDDVYFAPAAIKLLIESLTDSNQVVMANVPLRRPNDPPAAFLSNRARIPREATGLFEAEQVGFLFTVMSVGLLSRLPHPFSVLPGQVLEDYSAWIRLREIGARFFVNMGIKVGHIDGRNGHIYFSHRPPMKIVNGQLIETSEPALPFEVRNYGLRAEQWDKTMVAVKDKLLTAATEILAQRKASRSPWQRAGQKITEHQKRTEIEKIQKMSPWAKKR